jgi:hypothetical protein
MKRTFNYTGRSRIPLEAVSIQVYTTDAGTRWFDADLKLDQLKLPDEARVFVEAYFERAYRRYDFGTVAQFNQPEDRSLEGIDYGGRIRFRIKVTDLSGMHGMLLASADEITPARAQTEQTSRESLLPVEPRDDMGQEVWRVAFDGTGPFLEVNSSIDDVLSLFRNNKVIAGLVFPQALRLILVRALEVEKADETDDGWAGRWLEFGTMLTGARAPNFEEQGEEEVRNWIDSVTAALGMRLRGVDFIREAIREEKL